MREGEKSREKTSKARKGGRGWSGSRERVERGASEIAPRRRVDTVTAKGEKGGRENSGARRYFQVHF